MPDAQRRVVVAGATGDALLSLRSAPLLSLVPDPGASQHGAAGSLWLARHAGSVLQSRSLLTPRITLAGYTGKYVLEELQKRGYTPVALVRDAARARGPAFEGCAVVTGNVLEPATMAPACDGAVGIISCLASRCADGGCRHWCGKDGRCVWRLHANGNTAS